MSYHRTVIRGDVLSQESLGDMSLARIAEEITTGEYSGRISTTFAIEIDGFAMANLLAEQGSDPEFFGLDAHGQEVVS